MPKIKLTMTQETDLKELMRLNEEDVSKVIDIVYEEHFSDYGSLRLDNFRSLKDLHPKEIAKALIEGYDIAYQVPEGLAEVTIEEAEFVDLFTKLMMNTKGHYEIGRIELFHFETGSVEELIPLDRTMPVGKFIQAVVNGYEIE